MIEISERPPVLVDKALRMHVHLFATQSRGSRRAGSRRLPCFFPWSVETRSARRNVQKGQEASRVLQKLAGRERNRVFHSSLQEAKVTREQRSRAVGRCVASLGSRDVCARKSKRQASSAKNAAAESDTERFLRSARRFFPLQSVPRGLGFARVFHPGSLSCQPRKDRHTKNAGNGHGRKSTRGEFTAIR